MLRESSGGVPFFRWQTSSLGLVHLHSILDFHASESLLGLSSSEKASLAELVKLGTSNEDNETNSDDDPLLINRSLLEDTIINPRNIQSRNSNNNSNDN
jgi:hypothetical protein